MVVLNFPPNHFVVDGIVIVIESVHVLGRFVDYVSISWTVVIEKIGLVVVEEIMSEELYN